MQWLTYQYAFLHLFTYDFIILTVIIECLLYENNLVTLKYHTYTVHVPRKPHSGKRNRYSDTILYGTKCDNF